MSAAPTLDWVAVPSHIAEGPAEVRHKDGWLVCEVPADSYANLIAAAPELLKAAQELADRYPLDPELTRLQLAIAEAEGR